MTSQLALLGGRPVRTRPFPAWPVFGKAEEARLLRALRSGKWGRLQGDEVDIARAFEKVYAHRAALTAWDRARRPRRRKGPA